MTSPTERHRAWSRSWARTERAVPRDPFAGGVGSSPHTRGAPGCVTRDARRNRDHPRIRGEHSQAGARDGAPGGIIPAYAGSTLPEDVGDRDLWGPSPHTRGARNSRPWRRLGSGDHPRIRGEHLHRAARRRRQGGIIPAYAGNTGTRVCQLVIMRGSSPHTRGTRAKRLRATTLEGDHPRIRGEHANTKDSSGDWVGSSPHTRGTRLTGRRAATSWRDHPRIRGEHRAGLEAVLVLRGIIPAYAGNTSSTFAPEVGLKGSSPHTRGTRVSENPYQTYQRDHPRIRGEHFAWLCTWF